MISYSPERSNYILNQIINSIQLQEHKQQPILALNYIKDITPIIQQQPMTRLFDITMDDDGIKQVIPTLLAHAVKLILADCMEQVASYYPVYTFNPYIDLFVRYAENGGVIEKVRCHEALNILNGRYQHDQDYDVFVEMAVGIEDIINRVKLEMDAVWFKTLVYNAERTSEKNYLGLVEYINALLQRYSRLLVLRVDFGYLRDVEGRDRDWQAEFRQAKNDFRRFLDNMDSNSLFEHVVGYAWKMEAGPDKGWHFHVLFFCDGSQVREDETLAMLIGEYWRKLTGNLGLYHNCNANKAQYKTVGIGMVNYYDQQMTEALSVAAKYLTKIDHIARTLAEGLGRTFGRKEMPAPKVGNSGRPRSNRP